MGGAYREPLGGRHEANRFPTTHAVGQWLTLIAPGQVMACPEQPDLNGNRVARQPPLEPVFRPVLDRRRTVTAWP